MIDEISRSEDALTSGADWNANRCTDLLMGQALYFAQYDYRAECFG
jgi:hypothetical protein